MEQVLEGNEFGIKLGISDGEVLGTTLGYVYGLKLGGKEVSDQGLSDSSFDVSNVLVGVYILHFKLNTTPPQAR